MDYSSFALQDAMFLSSLPAEPENERTPWPIPSQFELYLESAARGNSFGLTRLGSLFCDNSDKITREQRQRAAEALETRLQRSRWSLSRPLVALKSMNDDDDASLSSMNLAKRFWFEGAIRGNPLAQICLADDIMFQDSNTNASTAGYDKSIAGDARLLAVTLFVLAAQQYLYGNNDPSHTSIESLTRVVQMEVAAGGIESEDEFAKSPVVQVASTILNPT
jgi:hypothetical protein